MYPSQHEESDTRMFYVISKIQSPKNIIVRCNDTDVQVISQRNFHKIGRRLVSFMIILYAICKCQQHILYSWWRYVCAVLYWFSRIYWMRYNRVANFFHHEIPWLFQVSQTSFFQISRSENYTILPSIEKTSVKK